MRIAAFTLFEMIIAMALLSIVIALVYTSVTMAGGRASGYSKSAGEHLELLAFTQHLEEDLAMASYVVYHQDDSFVIVNYDTTQINYHIENGFLYRQKEAVSDSIKVHNIEANTLESTTPKERILLRELWVETQLFGQPLRLYFFKEYYASNHLLML
ncbi:MAG: prepilin-type N-terminal cleavage/methylation domain-containing protein [Gilvibacter sp.]